MREVKSDKDCADCLCRVCARNEYNDCQNPECYSKICVCNCAIGDIGVFETVDDCDMYLPDIED